MRPAAKNPKIEEEPLRGMNKIDRQSPLSCRDRPVGRPVGPVSAGQQG